MGQAVVDYLVDFVHGLDDAPAEATEGWYRARAHAPRRPAGGWAATSTSCSSRCRKRRPRRSSTRARATSPTSPAAVSTRRRSPSSWRRASTATSTCGSPRRAWCRSSRTSSAGSATCSTYPAAARGLLTSGGSMANLSAIVTARHTKLGEDFLDGTYYVSEQVARQRVEGREPRGLLPAEPARWSRPTPSCGWTRMRCATMVGGRSRGRPPPVPGGARRPARRTPARSTRSTTWPTSRPEAGMWMHVDAAYGGFFQLTERGRERFARDRARRLDHARSAQGAVPAVRDRLARGPRRRRAARRARTRAPPTCRTSRRRASSRTSRSTRPSSRATEPRVPRVAAAQAARRRCVPRGARREARPHRSPPRRVLGRSRARDPVGAATDRRAVPPARAPTSDEPPVPGHDQRVASGCSCPARSCTAQYVLRVCIVSHRTHRDRIDECIDIVADAARELAGA